MKFLCTGDWHIDTKRPLRRKDDYWETVQRKIKFIKNLAIKENCTSILQPGDFFESHRASDFLKAWAIETFIDVTVDTVYGQHDLRYHNSDTSNTPLAVLESAGVICVHNTESCSYNGIGIKGASWFEDIPEIDKENKDNDINILLVHKMIIKNEKLWEGQVDYTMGNILLKTSGYDLIVAGDNHQHFTIADGHGRYLVNCGSLFRTKIDQTNHTPIVYIYDTLDRSITSYKVPCEPFKDVFDMEKYEEDKKRDEKIQAFVKKLPGSSVPSSMDFPKRVKEIVEEADLEDDIRKEVIEIIERTLK